MKLLHGRNLNKLYGYLFIFISSSLHNFSSFNNCTKLGEGTYGEVFKVLINGGEAALKVILFLFFLNLNWHRQIIPFAVNESECQTIVNGDSLKLSSSMFNELFITKELSKLSTDETGQSVTPSFIRFICAAVVKGRK